MSADRELWLYNSLTREKEVFRPLAAPRVHMYSCGPTVYAYPHLGNMRAYVFSDTLRRVLTWHGYDVTQVINITDVGHLVADSDVGDDKLETAAAQHAKSVWEIAEMYTEAFFNDLAALNIQPAHAFPRATAYVPKMIEFAKVLEEKGFTYVAPSGLYFDTSKSEGYGRLGLIDTEGQLAGARVEQVEGKRGKNDFAVWRTEAPGETRSMRWESPWGWGAPGWHLECSVMGIDMLGDHFDIHTGGVDHRELHHVNEIAQSEAYLGDGERWVRYWLHNEFLLLSAEKISKSAGHTLRVDDLPGLGHHPLTYRLFLLMAHYRSQADFTVAGLDSARTSFARLLQRTRDLPDVGDVPTYAGARAALSDAGSALAHLDAIDEAVRDDLNTPRAIAALQTALRDEAVSDRDKAVLVAAARALTGLPLGQAGEELLKVSGGTAALPDDEIEALVRARDEARAGKDWAEADRIRDELAAAGVDVVDTPEGSSWTVR